MKHTQRYFRQIAEIASAVDLSMVDRLVEELVDLRERGGRLLIIGVGGSAANCSHAVNDFRKLCGIEAYTPVDNVSELTARINDDGWEGVFVEWLKVSRATSNDALLVFSVGGGDTEHNVSVNIVRALSEAKARGMRVLGVVGRAQGATAKLGDTVVVVPTVEPDMITPYTESFQAVIWHCLVSHPDLQSTRTKW